MASPSADVNGGQLQPSSTWGEVNNLVFMVGQELAKMQTATLVKVNACTNDGGLYAVGFVDVTPMVHQVDGHDIPVPHGTIYRLPYLRIQGGANAVIIDPQAGDIGIAVFASRDISKVKATKAPAPPGSARKYSFSDGMYLGGVLNALPSQYVQFNVSGIKIHSPAEVVLEAPSVDIEAETVTINASAAASVTAPTFTVNANLVMTGTVSQTGGGAAHFTGSMIVDGDVTAVGTSVHTHVHSGVTAGGSNTGQPV